MSTLYRDYRPQNFSEVLGQKHIKLTLQNEIKANNIAQAFLFCGPRAVGKTTLARIFAKAVNCSERKAGEYEPCGKCDNCLAITSGNHLDIVEIDAASNTGVDNVRDNIISFSRLTPSKANYKVFIIDEVHMLSPSAFNALLKIIEEPPSYVVFILCTTEIHKVPNTIISRCERFDFQRISLSEIVSKLKKISNQEKIIIDDAVLEAVARQSGGHLRDAESLLGQVFALGDKKITLEQVELVIPHSNNQDIVTLLEYLANKDASKAIALVNSLIDNGIQIRNFIADTISILRKMIITKLSPELAVSLGLNLSDALELKISKINDKIDINRLILYAERLMPVYNEKNLLLPQLPLELAIIDLCIASGINTVKPTSSIPNQSIALKSNANEVIAKQIKPTIDETRPVVSELKSSNLPELDSQKVQLSCQEVLEKWPEFLIKIKKHNHSLSFVLQNCEPQAIQNNYLKLIFRYKFHQDRVKDESIKNTIETTLAEVYGSNIVITSDLDENLEVKRHVDPKNNTVDTEIEPLAVEVNSVSESVKQDSNVTSMNNLLKIFGGEVIN